MAPEPGGLGPDRYRPDRRVVGQPDLGVFLRDRQYDPDPHPNRVRDDDSGVPIEEEVAQMPGFAKSPPELVSRFDTITAGIAGAERRQMFGYPCLFVGGNMITGLHESRWFVRLPERDRQELLGHDGAGLFEVMPGRPMAGYVVLPPSIIADDGAARSWVGRAIDHGLTLQPKAAKASKAKAGGRG